MAICLIAGACGIILVNGCSSLDKQAKSEILGLRDSMTREQALAAANNHVPFTKLEYADSRPLPPPGMHYVEAGGTIRGFRPWRIVFTEQGMEVATEGSASFGTTKAQARYEYSSIVKVKEWRPLVNASQTPGCEVEVILYVKDGLHFFLYPKNLNQFLAAMMLLCPQAKTAIRQP